MASFDSYVKTSTTTKSVSADSVPARASFDSYVNSNKIPQSKQVPTQPTPPASSFFGQSLWETAKKLPQQVVGAVKDTFSLPTAIVKSEFKPDPVQQQIEQLAKNKQGKEDLLSLFTKPITRATTPIVEGLGTQIGNIIGSNQESNRVANAPVPVAGKQALPVSQTTPVGTGKLTADDVLNTVMNVSSVVLALAPIIGRMSNEAFSNFADLVSQNSRVPLTYSDVQRITTSANDAEAVSRVGQIKYNAFREASQADTVRASIKQGYVELAQKDPSKFVNILKNAATRPVSEIANFAKQYGAKVQTATPFLLDEKALSKPAEGVPQVKPLETTTEAVKPEAPITPKATPAEAIKPRPTKTTFEPFDPLKATPEQQVGALKNARLGTGKFQPGEIYTQNVMGKDRPILITKINPDKSVEGFYVGANSAAEAAVGIGEKSLQSAKWSNPTKELQTPTKPEIKPTDTLSQEATKYKSAEEFVKAQGKPVFHGSDKASLIEKQGFKIMPSESARGYGDGIYFTETSANAKGYGDVVKSYLPKNVKLYQATEADTYKIDTKKLMKEGYDGVKLPGTGGFNIFDTSKIQTKSQLTDIWNKANEVKPVESKPAIQGQTPSKIAKSIEQKAVEAKLTQGFEGVAGYDKITIKDQAERAAKLFTDPEKAMQVIRGEKSLPQGLRGTALIVAAEEHIAKTGDARMAYELANSPLVSETSAAAQELRLAAERQPDSITKQLQDLKNAREQAATKKYGTQAKSNTIKEIKSEVQKVAPKAKDWAGFLEEIKCT